MADSEWLMVKTKNGWLSEPALVILMPSVPISVGHFASLQLE